MENVRFEEEGGLSLGIGRLLSGLGGASEAGEPGGKKDDWSLLSTEDEEGDLRTGVIGSMGSGPEAASCSSKADI